MKVSIKNLGAVKSATIDLNKKLNVFCGRNSTGKTYMAYILYSITSLGNKSFGLKLDKNLIDLLLESNVVEIPLDLDQMFDFKVKESNKIKPNLWKLFSIPESKSNDFFSKTEIDLTETKEEFILRINKIKLNDKLKFHDYTFTIIKEKENVIKVILEEDIIKNESFLRYFDLVFLSILYSKLIYYPVMSSTIFPVERNSIFTFNKELSIKNNERYDLIKQLSSNKDVNPFDLFLNGSNRYPQPIRDCLKVADDLETIKEN